MALGPRLDLRQSQSLVMTPQLQQAIKLLALSNLEIEAFIGEALDANPLLEIGEAAPGDPGDGPDLTEVRRTTLESSPADQLIADPQVERVIRQARAGHEQRLLFVGIHREAMTGIAPKLALHDETRISQLSTQALSQSFFHFDIKAFGNSEKVGYPG